MEEKQITQLMLAMRRTGIKKLVLKKNGVELQLEREDRPLSLRSSELAAMAEIDENPMAHDFEKHRSHKMVVPAAHAKDHFEKAHTVSEKDEEATYITSPMVGTVYHAPSPNDPPFVKPGDKVEKNTVVCIIEAMKVMNEVKAGVDGIMSESLFENGQPVEFGTKLFRLTPAT